MNLNLIQKIVNSRMSARQLKTFKYQILEFWSRADSLKICYETFGLFCGKNIFLWLSNFKKNG